MTCFRVARRSAVLFLLCLGMSGCLPSVDSQMDEQKEPHFLRGKSLAKQMDFKGAVEAYEEGLKVNPNSAAAHYELAVLYEGNDVVADPAAAIYHYQRFLRLRPKANNADVVNTHIGSCKLELARTVSALPLTPSMQRDFDKLLAENRDLKAKIAQWQAYYNNRPAPSSGTNAASATNHPVAAAPAGPGATRTPANVTPIPMEPPPGSAAVVAPRGPASLPNRAAAPRTHTVKAGELPYAIAKRYGIPVEALMAANPQVNARRMKVGQVLTIPAP